MDRKSYEALTAMERSCLRLAHHERKTEQIAHQLGIRPSTVNAHIFSARRKLGGTTRFSAADALRAFEAKHVVGTPETLVVEATDARVDDRTARFEPTQSLSRQSMPMVELGGLAPQVRQPSEVREQRATFVFDDRRAAASGGQDRGAEDKLRRVALLLAIAALTVLVVIAAPAVYDSAAQRIANSLERPNAS